MKWNGFVLELGEVLLKNRGVPTTSPASGLVACCIDEAMTRFLW